jgi:hypothetical protein
MSVIGIVLIIAGGLAVLIALNRLCGMLAVDSKDIIRWRVSYFLVGLFTLAVFAAGLLLCADAGWSGSPRDDRSLEDGRRYDIVSVIDGRYAVVRPRDGDRKPIFLEMRNGWPPGMTCIMAEHKSSLVFLRDCSANPKWKEPF